MTGELNCGSLNVLNDEGWIILRGIIGLLIMRIIGGRILRWLIFPTPYMICLPYYLKNLTLLVCILGGILGYIISNVSLYFVNKSLLFYNIRWFMGRIWFIPYISTYGICKYPLLLGNILYKNIDQGWSEFFGAQNLYNNLVVNSKFVFFIQLNNLKVYLIFFVFWVIILTFIMIFV
jgi:NADH-ubiquinone oxidoreductase chain 5